MGGNQSNQNQVSKSLAESAELHKHVQTGNMTEVEKILLTASMEVVNGQENENRDTALMVAARNGNGSVVAALLKVKGIDLNVKNKFQKTALMIAAANGDNDTVLQFKAHTAPSAIDLNAIDEDGNTALMLALDKDNPLTVKALLSFCEILISKTNKDGNSALVLAATAGWHKSVKKIVKHAAYSALLQLEDKQNALMAAASNDRPLSIGEILERFPDKKDLDVNKGNEVGKTALIVACGKGCAEAARRLIIHPDTDVNCVDQRSYSALMYACENGFLHPVLALLGSNSNKQIKINAKNLDGYTALMIATQAGHTEIVRALLEHPSVNVFTVKDRQDGRRAAHFATSDNMRRIILEHEALLEKRGIVRAASQQSSLHESPRSNAGMLHEVAPDIDDQHVGLAPLQVPDHRGEVPPDVNPEPNAAPLLPVVPAQYIVFLEPKDMFNMVFKSKKEKMIQAIDGLQVYPTDFDKSIYACHGGGNFQIGVVYQREFRCGRDGRYKYRIQADYAEYKYLEFRDIVSALGAQSIKLLNDTQGSVQKKVTATLSASLVGLGVNRGKTNDTTTTIETSIEFSRPPKYQVVTKDTVNLANYEFRDEWQYIVDSRMRLGPMKKFVQNIHFESDVATNALVALKVKEVGLEVGGDYERTKGYTKSYEVTFFCPDDPEWAPPSPMSPSSGTTSQSSSSTLPISPSIEGNVFTHHVNINHS